MCFCLTPHYWRARLHLKLLVRPKARLVAGALPPVQQKLRESGRYIRHYVAAQQVGGGGVAWIVESTAARLAHT